MKTDPLSFAPGAQLVIVTPRWRGPDGETPVCHTWFLPLGKRLSCVYTASPSLPYSQNKAWRRWDDLENIHEQFTQHAQDLFNACSQHIGLAKTFHDVPDIGTPWIPMDPTTLIQRLRIMGYNVLDTHNDNGVALDDLTLLTHTVDGHTLIAFQHTPQDSNTPQHPDGPLIRPHNVLKLPETLWTKRVMDQDHTQICREPDAKPLLDWWTHHGRPVSILDPNTL